MKIEVLSLRKVREMVSPLRVLVVGRAREDHRKFIPEC